MDGWQALPGSFTVAKPEVVLFSRTLADFREVLYRLLSVRGAYSRLSLNDEGARIHAQQFETALFGDQNQLSLIGSVDKWSHALVKPNFLNDLSPADEIVLNENRLAFFDPRATQLVWFAMGPNHFFLLLVVAYPIIDLGGFNS